MFNPKKLKKKEKRAHNRWEKQKTVRFTANPQSLKNYLNIKRLNLPSKRLGQGWRHHLTILYLQETHIVEYKDREWPKEKKYGKKYTIHILTKKAHTAIVSGKRSRKVRSITKDKRGTFHNVKS